MRRILTSAFLLLLIGSLSVQAQRNDQQERRKELKERIEKRGGQQGQMRRGPQLMWVKLDLSEDQKEQIKALCWKESKKVFS